MTKHHLQLPFSDRLMLAVDRLVDAKIRLESEKRANPSYPAHVKACEAEVKSAQYGLTMMFDDVERKTTATRP